MEKYLNGYPDAVPLGVRYADTDDVPKHIYLPYKAAQYKGAPRPDIRYVPQDINGETVMVALPPSKADPCYHFKYKASKHGAPIIPYYVEKPAAPEPPPPSFYLGAPHEWKSGYPRPCPTRVGNENQRALIPPGSTLVQAPPPMTTDEMVANAIARDRASRPAPAQVEYRFVPTPQPAPQPVPQIQYLPAPVPAPAVSFRHHEIDAVRAVDEFIEDTIARQILEAENAQEVNRRLGWGFGA